eukprot:CAMPEP_0117070864 /NCGR_PEP_ID=MMETSP0472-20121206/49796_1 /TAXON_ID=693140 ORGANISM="Tiarina fusus, Strain LIS" /NCGR_SAMPLE_ID=MMETSP0472 /ASSEMBLY_ACC=CAM_ASM_000603 /LENGTH=84 /DNA_ID=CAMNT_0004794163 /DNA_START=44 /DNA_END=295 /DNA_ORIENTATION=+
MEDNGVNGFSGEPGQNGTRGGDGAAIAVDLSGTPSNLSLRFYAIQNGRKNATPFDQQVVDLGTDRRILIEAKGGAGGDGGKGGN